MAYSEKQEVDKQIEEWLTKGIIEQSTSEYASPIVLVRTKGAKRLCCNYSQLKKKIMRDNFSMHLIDHVVDKLQGSSVFTTLDLANGFFHVPIEENSQKYIQLL